MLIALFGPFLALEGGGWAAGGGRGEGGFSIIIIAFSFSYKRVFFSYYFSNVNSWFDVTSLICSLS